MGYQVLRRVRRLAAWMVGFAICRLPLFARYRKTLLASWSVRGAGGHDGLWLRAVLSYWFRFVYLAEGDPERREALKGDLMGGAAGVRWAQAYANMPIDFDAKVGSMRFAEACPLLPALDQFLGASAEPMLVVQIGSSSGREIAWLARHHPRHVYVGTDIYDEVVEFAAGAQRAPNLSFEVCSAPDIGRIVDRHRETRAIVFSSGSLQFVQPEYVEQMFRALGGGRGGTRHDLHGARVRDRARPARDSRQRLGGESDLHPQLSNVRREGRIPHQAVRDYSAVPSVRTVRDASGHSPVLLVGRSAAMIPRSKRVPRANRATP